MLKKKDEVLVTDMEVKVKQKTFFKTWEQVSCIIKEQNSYSYTEENCVNSSKYIVSVFCNLIRSHSPTQYVWKKKQANAQINNVF